MKNKKPEIPYEGFLTVEDLSKIDGARLSVDDKSIKLYSKKGNFLGSGFSLEEAARAALEKIKLKGDTL